ncbi:MAG: SusC/RagA family TonB-linked outer membrane protein [Crocinitomix sp.]|nr:SusC/RagA family TonB-linked outer membrane protein [Crocinitomix sp.]
MKRKFLLMCCLMAVQIVVYGQRKISGTVSSSEDDSGIVGVVIKIVGTATGTFTDELGRYELQVPDGADSLKFTFVGMEPVFKKIGTGGTIDVVMEPLSMLDEVVVTALGIKRDEKSLGYAVSQVSGDELRGANQTNLVSALAGNVAGANVTQASGTAGGSSRVVLRGFTSLTGDNEALFVIDGVKINNDQLNSESKGNATDGVANSNRGIDLNPDDIESITVLKGGAASALYGIDGANGVILITTKKGQANPNGGLTVSAGTSLSFSQVNKLPATQSTYSQGSAWYSGDGLTPEHLAPETGWLTSWGPAYTDLVWDGEAYDYDNNGAIALKSDLPGGTPVTPYDNVNNFFRTGVTTRNNVSISGGGETATFRFSVSDTRESGIVPNNTFGKTNVSLVSGIKLMDNKLNITTSANYINSGGVRIQQGSNLSGVMLGLMRTPITFDNANGSADPVNDPTVYTLADGSQRNFRGGGGYDNPWWTVNNNPFTDNVNRFLGNFQTSYKFSDYLTVSTNLGLDTYTDRRQQVYAINSRANPAGKIIEETYNVLQTDAYLLFSGGTYLDKKGDLDLQYQVGFNAFSYSLNNLYTEGTDFGFIGFSHLSNAGTLNSIRNVDQYRSVSGFASANLGYKKFLYLTVTGRQDYDSRFLVPGEEVAMSDIGFFYPSVSTSFVFSELLGLKNNSAFSFGKIRASWARVAKAPSSVYATSTTYAPVVGVNNIADGWTNGISTTGYLLDNVAGNPLLLPEISDEFEIGTALNFWNRRLSIDVSYYNRQTESAIVPATVSGATGYTVIFLNTGSLTTNGLDVAISGTPIQTKNVKWTIGANFSKYKTIVNELSDGLDQLFLGGFTGTGVYHIPGQEFGQIYGGVFLRDDAGNMIINDDPTSFLYGYPLASSELEVIGNPNPDFLLGITNRLRVADFTLSFLFDMKVGGEMWNGTQGAMTFFGTSANTENRDIPGAETTVFEGIAGHVDADGNVVTSGTNDVLVGLNEDWYTDNGGGFGSVAEHFIQDASTYRLRNASLSYAVPAKKLVGNALSEVRFTLSGNNLLLFTPYEGIDPETSLLGSSSNGQGLDYFNMPNTRSVTFGINVKF